MNIKRFIITSIFEKLRINENTFPLVGLISSDELWSIDSQTMKEFYNNHATRPYVIYLWSDQIIFSASIRNGSYVIKYDFNGKRI